VRDAALANGILIHGLDFDDTHLASIVHPTAACLPCALSLSEELGLSGRDLLTAYAAGMETAIRIGAAVKGGFHHVGFHATGLVAHFSSAVVAAKLLGLDAEGIVAAQGVAASTASGVQVFLEEGAWTKRFHPGWAAVAGITAAYLVRHGFVGPSRPYEGKFGLFDTHLQGHAGEVDLDAIGQGLGATWHLADTAIKPYPVCHFIHGCADAAVELHRLVDAEEIAAVEAFLPKDTMPIVAEPAAAKERPTTDYEAKFSAQFVVATCLLKGRFGLPELQPDALADARVRALAERVRCSVDPNSAFPTYFSGGVRVMLKDSREVFRHVRVNSGAGERALTQDEVVAKFMASASLAVDRGQAGRIRDVVLDLENRAVADLAVLGRAAS
jgi:2-methylcitrate dehydratase PrpD